MSDANILVRIRGALPSLRPAERRVAEAILADPAAAAELSISALARQCATSETTVMRLCRSLGMERFPELRLALARAASIQEARFGAEVQIDGDISATDSLADVVRKIGFSDARAIEDTTSTLDIEALGRSAEAVNQARRIDLYGVGASGFVCQDLHQKLHRIGLLAFAWPDPNAALTSAALLTEADVAVAISHTGTTIDTVESLRLASSRGATTIAITNFVSSPVTEHADLVLTTAARETTFRSGATASRIAQLAVVDCLFVAVAQRTYDSAMQALELTYAAVQDRRYPAR
ncbi:MurR/RpiR family transcriptional regulator [Rugosimonospora africana]|uniref:Transcriptional regulator n=1 Tax=Rugosimonospora africana TaxID=556532 RepID=A0A8J3QP99_9ACTN|nr:MurR/RpiR family transcriptional regulator [Rugosimonospora africana]GIH13894.1 transcriptional regulator [Rugosimonospora africana]